MIFGVFISPAAFVAGIVAVIIAMMVPFFVIDAVLSPLPDTIQTAGSIILSYIGMPVLLCYLHHKKVFQTGFASGFFVLYTWFFFLFGVLICVGTYYAENGPNYDGMAAGVVMGIVGIAMMWWRRRTANRFVEVVDENAEIQAAIDREEQIQIQAEAILRADEMRGNN